MSMMFGDDAVTAVWRTLSENGYDGKVFKYEKKETYKGADYIVINHLPFIHRGEVEQGVVNINIHAMKTKTNEPDTAKLVAYAKDIVGLFPKDTFINGAYYEYYADSRPTPDDDGTFYINVQLSVIYNDLN